MIPILLALYAQTIFQDPAGDFIVARNQLERSRSQPHFISKFRAGGRELAWTILPPGGRGAISKGPNDTFFYVNGNYLLQYRSDGFPMGQHKLSFGCETTVRAAQVNSKGQIWITGESACPISAVGEVFTLPQTLHEPGSFTAEIKSNDGSVTWLSPRLGGGLIMEAPDGSLVAVSRVNWTVTQMTPDASRMIGQLTLSSGESTPPQWIAMTADQKLIVAGTSASRAFLTSSDAQQKTLECFQTPTNLQCTSAVLTILSPEIRDVLYSTYLPNSERLDGFRLGKDQLELFVKSSFLRQVASGSVEGECPWYEKRLLVPLNSPRETSSLKLPSQLRIAQSLLPEGSTRYFYSPADPIDAVYVGDTAQPEPDFCTYSSLDGEPAREWIPNTYYSMFFAKPRPGAKLTLGGESPRVVFQSPTQINFQVSARFFNGIFAVDGIPIDYSVRGHRWPTILRADPFGSAKPALALITDERGRLLTEENAAGPGDRVFIYTEGSAGPIFQSAPDEYPRVFPLGLIFESRMGLPEYPNLGVFVARVPFGRPTDKPRRFYVGSPVGGGGPSNELITWFRLQY